MFPIYDHNNQWNEPCFAIDKTGKIKPGDYTKENLDIVTICHYRK